jgi:hypothetical protein
MTERVFSHIFLANDGYTLKGTDYLMALMEYLRILLREQRLCWCAEAQWIASLKGLPGDQEPAL